MNFQERKAQRQKNCFRWAFVILAVGALVFVGVEYCVLIVNGRDFGSPGSLNLIPYLESTKTALSQKVDTSKALFQSSLVAVGVLWGLVIAKKGEAKLVLGHRIEMAMFFIGNAIMAVSWYAHSQYLDTLTAISANPNPPMSSLDDVLILDFRHAAYNNYLTFQTRVWIAGIFVCAMTLFSAHVLRESPDDAK